MRLRRAGKAQTADRGAEGCEPRDAAEVAYGRSPLARRRRWAWSVGLTAVALAVGSGLALGQVRSPEQEALDTAPPARSVLTAQVSRTAVSSAIVGRGTVEPVAPTTVSVPVAPEGIGRLILSDAPLAVGGKVKPGRVVAVVSGRPIIALAGKIPAYRDLRPGDQGPDVAQLQEALSALGFTVDIDGDFGSGTKDALRKLYKRAGYQTPSTSGPGEPADPELSAARQALAAAQRAVAALERQVRQGVEIPKSSAGVDAGGLSAQLGEARVLRDEAHSTWTQIVRVSGPTLPMREVVFLPTFPATVLSLAAQVGGELGEGGAVATLNASAITVTGSFEASRLAQLRVGMKVNLTDEASGWTGSGEIMDVGAAHSGEGASEPIVAISPTAPVPPEIVGRNLLASVVQVSSGSDVLAVPIAAVTASADGSTYVVRVGKTGSQTKVVVTTGIVGDGVVEILSSLAPLEVGDLVVTSQ